MDLSTVTIEWYVALSAILFTIGSLGVLLRRDAIIIFMSVELMLNSANLLLVAFVFVASFCQFVGVGSTIKQVI